MEATLESENGRHVEGVHHQFIIPGIPCLLLVLQVKDDEASGQEFVGTPQVMPLKGFM